MAKSVFNLPERLSHKADPALTATDERHFAAIADNLSRTIADLSARRDAEQATYSSTGRDAMDRDMEVHRLGARLRALSRFGSDLCLGHMVAADNSEPVYIGRLGLTDSAGQTLLIDWRSPAAEPFFGATHANPMGLVSRRRYRWTRGKITDYWDEVLRAEDVFAADGLTSAATLDDESAFIASLGSNRSAKMRDVLGTIASDQDAIIRAGSRGALVVDGGPGTGKTVVALHRAAYLLYSDPRLGHHRGGVLFVGPHEPYLAYVADVLPSLGEEGVATCTVRDLVTEGATAGIEDDPEVARLKSSAELVKAIEAAVKFYEQPPAKGMTIETPWSDLYLSAADWATAFDAPEAGTPHNEAREIIWEELLAILADGHAGDITPGQLRMALSENEQLRSTLHREWPMINATDLVADLWSVPAYLRKCAPWLNADEVAVLQRDDAQAWTVSDLPLLDAARRRLGDPGASERRRRRVAAVAAEQEQRSAVVDHLIAADDSDLMVMSMLRGQDLRNALIGDQPTDDHEERTADLLAGPFAHIVVDEAQELTDAQWQMLLSRCPSRSFTVVGDRAQARAGFASPGADQGIETWQQRLGRVGMGRISMASLSINYRTPEEVMTEAEPVIRAVLPDANVPTSVRGNNNPVEYRTTAERDSILDGWLADNHDGIACVIGDPTFAATVRIRSLTPELAKGLEFDLVVLVDPEAFGDGDPVSRAVDRYVAMTRATQRLVILRSTAAGV
ncbi:RNA polymerase recycling motor ATPase HelR [Nocardia sp. 348MFTsu5.1]|uniref:RNA polymerase recycling motor ATPase HelR n=1 Tax=Nocardia sp. 348MFTsu5.1 TaxID=1172185 RepID=UPI0003807027|nr:RNA polymerase recycling motor ATPase HelR [Nocardia sp. 348MFTsu5.1]